MGFSFLLLSFLLGLTVELISCVATPIHRSSVISSSCSSSSISSSWSDAGGYDIFVVMGQSNAYGTSSVTNYTSVDVPNRPDLLMYSWGSCNHHVPELLRTPLNGLYFCFDGTIPQYPIVGLATTFAESYADAGCLQPNRSVLIVMGAAGGTSVHGGWEVHGAAGLLDDSINGVKDALTMGPNPKSNVVKGLLWHQGEADAEYLFQAVPYTAYYPKMLAIIDYLRSDSSVGAGIPTVSESTPFINGGLVPEWWNRSNPYDIQRLAIESFIESLPTLRNYTWTASSHGLEADYGPHPFTDQFEHIHFAAESERELGRRFFQAWIRAQTNNHAPNGTDDRIVEADPIFQNQLEFNQTMSNAQLQYPNEVTLKSKVFQMLNSSSSSSSPLDSAFQDLNDPSQFAVPPKSFSFQQQDGASCFTFVPPVDTTSDSDFASSSPAGLLMDYFHFTADFTVSLWFYGSESDYSIKNFPYVPLIGSSRDIHISDPKSDRFFLSQITNPDPSFYLHWNLTFNDGLSISQYQAQINSNSFDKWNHFLFSHTSTSSYFSYNHQFFRFNEGLDSFCNRNNSDCSELGGLILGAFTGYTVTNQVNSTLCFRDVQAYNEALNWDETTLLYYTGRAAIREEADRRGFASKHQPASPSSLPLSSLPSSSSPLSSLENNPTTIPIKVRELIAEYSNENLLARE